MLYIRVGVHKVHGLMCMGITLAVYYTSFTICDSFAGVELLFTPKIYPVYLSKLSAHFGCTNSTARNVVHVSH